MKSENGPLCPSSPLGLLTADNRPCGDNIPFHPDIINAMGSEWGRDWERERAEFIEKNMTSILGEPGPGDSPLTRAARAVARDSFPAGEDSRERADSDERTRRRSSSFPGRGASLGGEGDVTAPVGARSPELARSPAGPVMIALVLFAAFAVAGVAFRLGELRVRWAAVSEMTVCCTELALVFRTQREGGLGGFLARGAPPRASSDERAP